MEFELQQLENLSSSGKFPQKILILFLINLFGFFLNETLLSESEPRFKLNLSVVRF